MNVNELKLLVAISIGFLPLRICEAERMQLLERTVQALVILDDGKRVEAVDGCLKIKSEEVLSTREIQYPPPVFNFEKGNVRLVVPTGGTSPMPTEVIAEASSEVLHRLEKASARGPLRLILADEANCKP